MIAVGFLLGLPLVFTIRVVNFIGGYIPDIGAYDDRCHHEPHEAPGQDTAFGNPAQRRRGATRGSSRGRLLSRAQLRATHQA